MAKQSFGKTVAKLAFQTVMFIATEALLGSTGLDTIADYSEFISHQEDTITLSYTYSVEVMIPQLLSQYAV
ncbi:MAG: hypothetical protein VKJ24_10640 [Synechococcales bacterium]|nr:hypothetical protein [Synechococcales bacterium]